MTATANESVGSYYVGAIVGSLNNAFALTNTAGAPARLVPAGTPQSAVPGTAFAEPLEATVLDSGGNPLPGVAVNFSVPTSGAGATLSAVSTVTNSYGVASVIATANSMTGSYSVTAKAGSLSATFSLANSPFSACDVNQDGKTNVLDVQQMIREALGNLPPDNDLNGDHVVNVVDIQLVINAVMSLGCLAG